MDAQTATAPDPGRREELAARLDHFTEADLVMLTDASPKTVEAWRKRGIGPSYVRAGNSYLYPRAGVVDWLGRQVRERKPVEAKAML